MPITLGELAGRFDCELIGDAGVSIDSVGSLQNAGTGAVSFLGNSKLKGQLSATKASAVICRKDDADGASCAVLIHDDPYACFARVAAVVCPVPEHAPGIHDSAVIDDTAEVSATAHVADWWMQRAARSKVFQSIAHSRPLRHSSLTGDRSAGASFDSTSQV